MSEKLIDESYEFCEVINAFPIIKDYLSELNFSLNDIKESETIKDYFEKKQLSDYEIGLLVNKLNHKIKVYLQKDPPEKQITSEIPLVNPQPLSSSDNEELLSEEE